jgi:photosystem II stability/assembly factor-like uncharacterized protein
MFCFATSYAQEWGYVNTLQNEILRKICTQGTDTVYIAGENGLIARSADHAMTWNKQYPVSTQLNDIIFCNYETGFVVGNNGVILKTGDGGNSWTQIPSGTTKNINAIAASGLNNIWAAGDSSLILHSVDNGNTWTQEFVLAENNIQLLDIAFRDSLGYFCGNFATVYKTDNYGIDWIKQTVVEKTFVEYYNAHSINITDNKAYIMMRDELYSTENHINWSYIITSQINPFFLNDSVGSSCELRIPIGSSSYGALYIITTGNGGANWNDVRVRNIDNSVNFISMETDIVLVNDTLGYAVNGEVLVKKPAPVINGIDNLRTDSFDMQIKQQGNTLQISSQTKTILSNEIISISGIKLIHSKNNPAIDISSIPKGVYFIYTVFMDNTKNIAKWLKY